VGRTLPLELEVTLSVTSAEPVARPAMGKMVGVVDEPLGVTTNAVERMLGPDGVSVSGIVQSSVVVVRIAASVHVPTATATSGDGTVSVA
jgi:hypothetical protein